MKQKMSPPGEKWRTTTNSSRKNEVAGPEQKRCPVVDVSGDEIKIRRCKEQYCIGTWNVKSMNQGIILLSTRLYSLTPQI